MKAANCYFEPEVFAERLNVTTQGAKGIGVVSALLDPCNLRLGNAEPFSQLYLSQASLLARFRELQPDFLLFGFFVIDGTKLWIPCLLNPVFVVPSLSFCRSCHLKLVPPCFSGQKRRPLRSRNFQFPTIFPTLR